MATHTTLIRATQPSRRRHRAVGVAPSISVCIEEHEHGGL